MIPLPTTLPALCPAPPGGQRIRGRGCLGPLNAESTKGYAEMGREQAALDKFALW